MTSRRRWTFTKISKLENKLKLYIENCCRENRLLIIGYSFVRRMKMVLSSADWDVIDDYESVEVIGVGGMRVSGLAAYLRHARRTRPTVVVLDAGTNDCQGTTMAARLHVIACQYAILPSVRHVILGEVIRRGDGKAQFETQRVVFNSELRRLSEIRCDIHTIRHRGGVHHVSLHAMQRLHPKRKMPGNGPRQQG